METKYVVVELAKSFIERSEALGYKGKKRDDAALDYFCGAAKTAQFLGNESLYQHLSVVVVTIVSVRGFFGVNQLAAIKEKDPA